MGKVEMMDEEIIREGIREVLMMVGEVVKVSKAVLVAMS